MGIRVDRITVKIEYTEDFRGHHETTFSLVTPDYTDPFVRAVLERNTQIINERIAREGTDGFGIDSLG